MYYVSKSNWKWGIICLSLIRHTIVKIGMFAIFSMCVLLCRYNFQCHFLSHNLPWKFESLHKIKWIIVVLLIIFVSNKVDFFKSKAILLYTFESLALSITLSLYKRKIRLKTLQSKLSEKNSKKINLGQKILRKL